MVRLSRLFCVAGLLVALAASAGSGWAMGSPNGADTPGSGIRNVAPISLISPTARKADSFRVCLVLDVVGLAWNSFNALEAQGLMRAERELGVTGTVLASKSQAEYLPNLRRCAQAGADLTIAAGFLLADAARQAALQLPASKFATVDYAYNSPAANLAGLVFKSREAGFLAGYLAALMSKSGTISSVGGIKGSSPESWIVGYQAGARAANPKVLLLSDYSGSFVDQGKCHDLALSQIARGADVVLSAAGACGGGALAATAEKGVWGIGVDVDHAYLGTHILSSAVKRVDKAVFQTIQMAVNGQPIGGGNISFGLAEKWVDLGATSSAVPQQILDQVAQQLPRPLIGRVTIFPAPTAGRRVTVSFPVTRSDTRQPLTAVAAMASDPRVAGKPVKHVEQFTYGIARLTLTLPKNVKGTQLTVKLTINAIGRSATTTATFGIR